MRFVAMRIIAGVSITLIEGADGWRFDSWRDTMGQPEELEDPPPGALARRFRNLDDAISYFRGICPVARPPADEEPG